MRKEARSKKLDDVDKALVELADGEEMIDESAVLEAYKNFDNDLDDNFDNNSSLGLGSDTGGLDDDGKL